MSQPQTLPIRHILVEHVYEAEDLMRLLKKGDSFESLARKYSKCSSAPLGGDLGDIPLKKLDEDFREVAMSLKAGEISKPLKTRFGVHLIKRD
jgi:parvulin-like peptidyl-prolyl isomerase